MRQLTLTQSQVQQMIAHARAEAPLEACGLLGGEDGRVLQVYPAVNVLQSPTRYQIEPEQLLSILESIDAQGCGPDPLAIYHSHPHGPGIPSKTDVAESYYPNSVYIIIAHPDSLTPSLRGFRIVDGEVSEVQLKILNDRQRQRQDA